MALSRSEWDELTPNERDATVAFLQNNCRIDLEKPERKEQETVSYPIAEGYTRAGDIMKRGDELRINVRNIDNIPPYLDQSLRERGSRNRIGGSEAIRAIMQYGGFELGDN
jgi:hypothetical protein